jgi:hypothetical protein
MKIIDADDILKITREVATRDLATGTVGDVKVAPTFDSTGRDALEITITLTPGSSALVTGNTATTTIFHINQKLQEAGEEPFPIVRWEPTPSKP